MTTLIDRLRSRLARLIEPRGASDPAARFIEPRGADDPAFAIYREVRDAIARIRHEDAADGSASPSAYWSEELANIDYMADASPIIIAKLRHHAFQVTGIRPYDYRAADDERARRFEERLRALAELGGDDLVVPEHEALGGFGYRIDGRLFNLDTLKFLEVMVGLKKSGALDALARAKHRKVVWEIGGGWGGFAYHFKTLRPDVTYVITDLPELFLFSATYLRTVFPDARTLVVAPGTPSTEQQRWREYDFVFVPNTRAAALNGFKPNLTVNIASFQEMTSAQVAGYVGLAARGRCPWIYSLNRDRSRYNTELSTVSEHLGAHYDLQDVQVLDTEYTKAMKKTSRKADRAATVVDELTYRHIAGRLREPGTSEPAR